MNNICDIALIGILHDMSTHIEEDNDNGLDSIM